MSYCSSCWRCCPICGDPDIDWCDECPDDRKPATTEGEGPAPVPPPAAHLVSATLTGAYSDGTHRTVAL